jgi:hypothetical protein
LAADLRVFSFASTGAARVAALGAAAGRRSAAAPALSAPQRRADRRTADAAPLRRAGACGLAARRDSAAMAGSSMGAISATQVWTSQLSLAEAAASS